MRTFVSKRGQRSLVTFRNGRNLLCLATALALGVTATATLADESDAASMAYAQRLAIGVWGTCPGPHGNSQQAKFPILAGQSANYLANQLKAFRGQTRGDPDALGYMWGMASPLTDVTIHGVSEYYASQKPGPGRPGDPQLVGRGEDVYKNGVPAKGIPACAACHGPNA